MPKPSPLWLNRWEESEVTPADRDEPRFVPLVEIITGSTDILEIREFVAVWMIVREMWVERALYLRRPPSFATKKAWRLFATGAFRTPSTEEVQRRVVTVRRNFAGFLEKPVLLAGEQGLIGRVSLTDIQSVIQELADLNFYFDMLEVEHRLTGASIDEISDRMRPITGSSNLIMPGAVARSTTEEVGVWLTKVRDFIDHWPGDRLVTFDIPLSEIGFTTDNVFALEFAVAEFFCCSASRFLGRRAVLPRYCF